MNEPETLLIYLLRSYKMESAILESRATLRCLINYGPDINGELAEALKDVLQILDDTICSAEVIY